MVAPYKQQRVSSPAQQVPTETAEGPGSGRSDKDFAPLDSLKLALAILIGCLVGFLAEKFWLLPLQALFDREYDLVVDASIESGKFIEVFVNNEFDHSYRDNIVPGEPHRYVFHKVPGHISAIRLDITDSAETKATLKGIQLVSEGKPIAEVAANEMLHWGANQLEVSPAVDASGQLSVRSTLNDPFIYSTALALNASSDSASRLSLLAVHAGWFIIAAALLYLLSTSAGRQAVLPVLLLCGATRYLNHALGAYIGSLHFGTPDVSGAVGQAAYIGYPKQPEQLALAVTFVVSCLVGLALGLGTAWVQPELELAESKQRSNLKSGYFVLAALLVFAVGNFPPLLEARSQFASASQSLSGYDWGNVFTWDYLYLYGFIPLRDYWFPYGADYNQLGLAPESLWSVYLVQLVLFSAILASLVVLCERQSILSIAVLLCLGLMIENGDVTGTKRYLGAVALVLATAACLKRKPRSSLPFCGLGVLAAWLFYREANQLVYTAPAIGLLILWSKFDASSREDWVRERKRLCLALGTFGILVGLQLFELHHNGQLPGFIGLYLHMGAMSTSVSIPAPFWEWFSFSPKFETLVTLGTEVIAAVGAYLLCRKPSRETGVLLLAMASVLCMIYFKMLLRPHMAQQMVAPLVLSIGLYAAYWLRFFNLGQYFALAAALGACVAYSAYDGVFARVLRDREARLVELPANLKAAATGLELSKSELDEHFSRAHFQGFDADTKELVDFLSAQDIPRFGGQLFVFGDDSYLYPLFQEKPCPYITFYNTSDIWAQNSEIECLESDRPRIVVWDSSFKIFDGVPNLVRVPLLYDYVTSHFAFDRAIGRFQILRPREEKEPIDWNYWSTQLGQEVDLGAIPNYSHLPMHDCFDAPSCLDFAIITLASSNVQGSKTISVDVAGRKFSVAFSPLGKKVVINLSRLWFWSLAKSAGLSPQISPAGPDAALEITSRRTTSPNVLY